jgi:hypothetical protein
MNKKITRLLLFSGAVVLVSAGCYLRSSSSVVSVVQSPGGAMDDDEGQRERWELRRLAAPDGKIPDQIREKELAFAAALPGYAPNQSNRTTFSGWINRGPWNVGGRTRAFGADILNENNLLAGTTSGGIWRSTDGGGGWSMMTGANTYHGVTCMVQDQRSGHETTWYTGSGEGYGASASGGGAYYLGNGLTKSTDNGLTWTSIASTATGNASSFSTNFQIVWNLALDKHNLTKDVIYAALYGEVLKSVNGGTSWTAFKTSSGIFTDVAVNDSGTVYVTIDSSGAAAKGIWRSPDGVAPLAKITPPNFPTGYNRIVMGFNPMNQNEVYFLANTPSYGKKTINFLGDVEWNSLWKYTYVSGNGSGAGGVWQNLSANLPGTGTYFDTWNVQGSYDMIVRVNPKDSNSVFIGGTNLYRSTSAFADSSHTTKIGGYTIGAMLPVVGSYANHHPDQHVIAFSPSNPKVLYSCNDGGVFKTNDNTAPSVTWTSLDHGYVTSMFYTVALDHASPGNNILIGGAQDNGSWYTNSANASTPWVHPGGGDGSYCAIADSQKAYYYSIQNGKTIKAMLDANGGVTSFRRIDPIGGKGYQFINPFVIDPNNNNIMYMTGGKNMWRNDNLSTIPMSGGWDSISTNWVKFADTIPATGSTITAVAISKSPANRLYYGTDAKHVYRLDNASTGVPGPPTDISGASFPATGFVSSIAVDPNNADNLMVVFSNYGVYSIFNSTDGGGTWAKSAGNLEQDSLGTGNGPSIRWGIYMPVSNGYVYMVGTSTGIYATDTLKGLSTVWVQQGASWWLPPAGNIGNSVCEMIDYRQSDGLTVVATHANGMYSANITSVSDITSVKNISALTFGLNTYPNPFTDQCTVTFTLQKATRVRVSVYDEQGREVSVLADGQMPNGNQTLLFNKGSLSSGVYYLGLKTSEGKETRKMVILY